MSQHPKEQILKEGSSLIGAALSTSNGLVARAGETELRVWAQYGPEKPPSRTFGWRVAIQAKLNAGISPPTRRSLRHYSRTYGEAFGHASVIATWEGALGGERRFLESNAPSEAPRVPLEVLDSVYLAAEGVEPWSSQLDGQRVLVIAPFAPLARTQMGRRLNLFAGDINPLPEMQVVDLVPPQTQGLEVDHRSWRTRFDFLRKRVDSILPRVDCALVAAGSYGMPISAHLSHLGIPTVYVGGCLQLLFGISGRRWHTRPFVEHMRTKNWINPDIRSRPRGARLIEGGAYW